MTTVSEAVPIDHEVFAKPEENPVHHRPPTRNLRTPRTEMNSSSKARRSSVEQKESREVVSANKKPKYQPSDKIVSEGAISIKSVLDKNQEFEEGITLDKIFGGTYKKIEIFNPSEKSGDDLFPSAPFMNRRSTLHETLELNEIEEEDEENYEGRKRSSQGFSRRERGAGSMSLRVGYDVGVKSPRYDEKSNLPTFESAQGSDNSVYIPRRTLTNFYDKVKDEAREDSQTRTTRAIRGSVEKKSRQKTVHSQSKSPTPLRRTGQNFTPAKGVPIGKVPIIRPTVGSRRSIDDIKNTIDESVRNETMHSTFGNPFYPKQIEREIIRNAEFMNEFTKKILPFDASKARSSNQLEMNEDRFSHKKNKFLYQNAVLQEKIRDEEKMLLSKYCTKFGLNVQDYYGKQTAALNNTSTQHVIKANNFDASATKKNFSPFLRDTKFGTFYKVGVGKTVFNN